MAFFLKTLLIIFCIYWIIKTVFKFALVRFVQNVSQKAEQMQKEQAEMFKQQYEAYQEEQNPTPEGEIRVKTVEQEEEEQKSLYQDDSGDYIDFEDLGDEEKA